MYKAVEEKKISAGIWHTTGRNGYAGRETWRGNGDIQKCVVHYKVTKMRMSTEELKTESVKKSLFNL